MKKKSKLAFRNLVLTAVLFALIVSPVVAKESYTSSAGSNELIYESYTYWEDLGAGQKSMSYTKPTYTVKQVISPESLGQPIFDELNDICTDENGNVYILDGGASQIIKVDAEYKYVKTFGDAKYTGEAMTIYSSDKTQKFDIKPGDMLHYEDATGIFVKNGLIYIADTENWRVIVMNDAGEAVSLLTIPVSKLIPDDFKYKPLKVAVDSKDYTYVICDGSYYGAVVYSPQMEFLGFYGANTVSASVLDVLQNLFTRLFSNDEKRSGGMIKLPYQFIDMAVGSDDFIYTATGRASEGNIGMGQVSVLNPGGKNILGKDDFNFVDTAVGVFNRFGQTQSVVGIDVDEDGFFYIVDAGYGRVFWYDQECHLMSVFGGSFGVSIQDGTNRLAKAIALKGLEVLVCDSQKNTVNVYELTDYGKLLRKAQLLTLQDEYEQAMTTWQEVVGEDQNCQLAYRGLAKAYYTTEDNEQAMKYAELGADRVTYANAFVKIRTAKLENTFIWIFLGVLVLVALLVFFIVMKRRRNWVLFKNEKLRIALGALPHPVESFRLVKEKQMGSMPIAIALLAIFYILSAIKDTASGFAFNYFDASNYNSFYVFLSTVGLVCLWTLANWLICVLMGGIGKLKEIFIVTCYSLTPLIIGSIISLIFTYVLSPDEYVFITLLTTVLTLYAAFMLIIGIMRVHDFEFGRFLGTTILSLISMLIIVFLIFLVILLAQQVFSFIMTLFVEIKYR